MEEAEPVVEETVRHPRRGSNSIRGVLSSPRDASGSSSTWAGMGEAWSYLSTIVSGVLVWGAIGYGLDRLLSTAPVLLVVGALVGNSCGIYLVYARATRQSEEATRRAS